MRIYQLKRNSVDFFELMKYKINQLKKMQEYCRKTNEKLSLRKQSKVKTAPVMNLHRLDSSIQSS